MKGSEDSSRFSQSPGNPNVVWLEEFGSVMISGGVRILGSTSFNSSLMKRVTFEADSVLEQTKENAFHSNEDSWFDKFQLIFNEACYI
jgi:hypothetical protein